MSAGWGARPVWWLERLGGWGEAAITGAQGTNPSGLMTAPCCWWRPCPPPCSHQSNTSTSGGPDPQHKERKGGSGSKQPRELSSKGMGTRRYEVGFWTKAQVAMG